MKLPTGLTKVEISALGELVDSPHWRPLVKLMALKQMELAQNGVMSSPTMEALQYTRGQVISMKWLEESIRKIHKDQLAANIKEQQRNKS